MKSLCYVEIYQATQNTGDHIKKTIAFPEGKKLFPGDFPTNLDETNADKVRFTKRWNCRKVAATNVSSAPKYVHLQGWSLKSSTSSYDGWEKYKKIPDASDPNQNVNTTCNSKLKCT